MSTKNSGPFGIVSIQGSQETHLDLVQPNHALTREEKHIVHELGRQNLIIEGQRVKTIAATAAVEDIETYSMAAYQNIAASAHENYQRIASEPYAPYVAEFNRRTLENGGRALLSIATSGATNIQRIVDTSLDTRPEPGLLRRLLG